jgi:hypothetical protein
MTRSTSRILTTHTDRDAVQQGGFKDVVAPHADVLNSALAGPARAPAPVLGELRRAAPLRRTAPGDPARRGSE